MMLQIGKPDTRFYSSKYQDESQILAIRIVPTRDFWDSFIEK